MPAKKEKQPLSVTHPELAKEADGWDPSTVTAGAKRKARWKCSNMHTYESSIHKRTSRNDSCPICSNKIVLQGFNDLATKYPLIALEANGWDPNTVVPGSAKPVSWKCSLGHIWAAQIRQRAIQGLGCPYCSNQRVLPGFNDLLTHFPEMAKQADGWNPSELTYKSHSILTWKCEIRETHKWRTSPKARARIMSGCPYCANKKIEVGFNDLATTHPDLALEADGWDPRKVTFGTRGNVSWKCAKGHNWKTSISNRRQSVSAKLQDYSSCPYCANKKVLVGFNDLQTLSPKLAGEAFGWNPTEVSIGSSQKKKWICIEGHTWTASVSDRRITGCPSCAKTGFDPNADGFLYCISHTNWEMFQIGITNDPDTRLSQHKKLGWELLELRGPMDGHLTQQWETAILRMLKAKGADLSNAKIAGKFDGYSEAWSKSTFEAKSIKELMRLTEEFEGN